MESRERACEPMFKAMVCEMAVQMITTLKKLHKVGFCHWDLKLDNICLEDGFYYLIDFALS